MSFLTATAIAQAVNFFVQKNWVFRSNAQFSKAVPKYILLAVVLITISAALPAYSQTLLSDIGIRPSAIPTLANIVNIVLQVILSYPIMKFWVLPKTKAVASVTQ